MVEAVDDGDERASGSDSVRRRKGPLSSGIGKKARTIVLVVAPAVPMACVAPAEAATTKQGQFCKKADAGKRRLGLVWTKDGPRCRWG